jgi:hypothetical protein
MGACSTSTTLPVLSATLLAMGAKHRGDKQPLPAGRHDLVVPDTGEMISILVPKHGRRRYYEGGFLVALQAGARDIREARLSRTAYDTFFAMLEILDYENWIKVSQSDIARTLGVNPSQVNRAVRELEDAEIIFRGPKDGPSYSWRLNPHIGWKGKGSKRAGALEDLARQRWGLEDAPLVHPGQGSLLSDD